jgi:DNA-directed RNA polymerase specialized sigma24 family protein
MIGNFLPPAAGIGMPAGSPPDNVTDGALCAALATGALWAVDVFYTRVEDTVDAVLFRVVGATDIDRDALMQEALERILSSVVSASFSHAGRLTSWVTLVTQDVALDALRERAKDSAARDRDRAPGTPATRAVTAKSAAVERTAEIRRNLEPFLSALATTKREWAETVILHDLLGHELTELSVLTGGSLSELQSRLARGRHDVASRIAGVAL